MKSNENPEKSLADQFIEDMRVGFRQKPKSPLEYLQGMVELGRQTTAKMAGMDAARQARFVRRMFEHRDYMWVVWHDPHREPGYSHNMVKGTREQMESSLAAGQVYCRIGVFLCADKAEATRYALVGLGRSTCLAPLHRR